VARRALLSGRRRLTRWSTIEGGGKSMLNKRSKAVFGGVLVAVALAVPSGSAFADKTKDCGTTDTAAGGSGGSGNGNNAQWETSTTQTAACNSSSDTGLTTTTNNGGGHPK
jgi:hypothetical protein